jgi:S-adenosylmethionine hydrolase
MSRPVITFLTDFGPDAAPAVCRGVMVGICPDVRILDISHSVAKFGIRDGAWRLAFALPYMPVGVHVAVVDPGVGTTRRPIGIRATRGDVLIGPDNGLLIPPAGVLGGIVEARELTNPELCLPVVSSTFHGRDIFAPMAAHLAGGRRFDEVGPAIDPAGLTRLELPVATARAGGLDTSVIYIDGFGNAYLAGTPDDLAATAGPLEPGRRFRLSLDSGHGRGAVSEVVPWQRTFGGVPEGSPLLYGSSTGSLAWSDNQASLAARLGLTVGRAVRVEPVDDRRAGRRPPGPIRARRRPAVRGRGQPGSPAPSIGRQASTKARQRPSKAGGVDSRRSG